MKMDPAKTKKKRKRSKEAAERHRLKYLEILKRRAKGRQESKTDSRNDATNSHNSALKPVKICRYYYRNGSCVHGESCSFSHTCIPLKSKDLKLCQFYIKMPSECKYTAAECKYSHEPRLFLCRSNVLHGICPNEGKCQFNHIPEDNIKVLDDTEKLKFCYNNKSFLANLLVKYLKDHSLLNTEISNYKTELDLICKAYDKIKDHGSIPWYLEYIFMILEKDLITSANT
ncbi:hypothetical protein BEWA_008670 [Theileria equi strain WA]|uniref:C3H1-type domain-containing protein n=1 Tax=Theileria equi strain WA TaxID=1537102 RepID=L0B2L7_THEEQ|nr:hypothetical protein BEWA_008670 [Theileria equi strain WA]AFZ81456.1 hypothetical protein BEWA_008670 [Theileria equi strain WA]|eukprot:XP_004831122.1 hypothetical protein BEWA_008670 [Theileria equi strain WA]